MADTKAARRASKLQNEEADLELEQAAKVKAQQALVDADVPTAGCRFAFVGDPRDARRGPLFEMDEESGEDVEPPLRLMGLKFPRKQAVLVKDEFKIRKLRGNDHFIELKEGEDLAKALAKLPKATRVRKDNIPVTKLGVPVEASPRAKMSRRDRDMAEEFEGDGDRG